MGRVLAWTVGVLVVVLLFGLIFGSCSSINRTGPTEVGLIRNGGPFDDKSVREVRPPESGFKISGLFSEVRKYIASVEQRFYTVTSDPGRADNPSATYVEVPTRDGVQVRIEATTFFHTAFTGLDGDPLLVQFDQQYGNREFKESGSDDAFHVWDGTDGWSAFLDTIFRPVLVNTIREEIGRIACSDLVSSCALVQSGQDGDIDFTAVNQAGENNSEAFNAVQAGIQTKLAERVNATLGGPYIEDIQFRLERVVLPSAVQDAIDNAQSAFADVAQSRAQLEQSKFEAQRADQLASQYDGHPEYTQVQIAEILADAGGGTFVFGGDVSGLNLGR